MPALILRSQSFPFEAIPSLFFQFSLGSCPVTFWLKPWGQSATTRHIYP